MKKTILFIIGFLFLASFVWGDIIISEMCDPQTAYQTNRFIEIYNTGEISVDLNGWTVDAIINDGSAVAQTWTLSGSIASGEALVCGDDSNTLYTCDFAVNWTAYTSWNGKVGDGAKLYNGETQIDNAGAHGNFENKTTQRNANIGSAVTTFNSSEWTSTSTTNYENATPGTHVCDFPAGSSPLITLSELSLSGFSYIDGNGPSAEQSFTAQGSNLTSDISITAPTNYEISETSGSGYTSPITLTQSGGAVASTTIYVRLKASLSAGAYNSEEITCTSTDADNKIVSCNGDVFKLEPTNHVISFTATADGHSKIDLSWTENDGTQAPDNYLIKASTADNVSAPVDGTPVADNTTIGNDSGAVNISHGTSAYEWAGLSAETTYYFEIYPYTNSGSAINYKTDGTIPGNNASTGAEPAIPELLISEVADPSDVAYAKYVELYNASGSTITFDATRAVWYLCRQANGGSWGDVLLTGSIAAGATYIVAYNLTTFEATFGISADLYSSNISGNGNDGYFLYYGGNHSTGTLSDAYGVIDLDGTGEPWEYLDSHAVRNAGVTEPNSTWTASEYTIPASATAAECTPGDSPLPVTLSSFTASYSNNTSTLYWVTESESDNLGWNVYRANSSNLGQASILNLNTIPGNGTTTEPSYYSFADEYEIQFNSTYWYWLESIAISGETEMFGPVALTIPLDNNFVQEIPVVTELHQNFPNPFNPNTSISFDIKEGEAGVLTIYNFKGQLIEKQMMSAGEHTFEWDGTAYSSGVYLYKLETDSYIETKKMLMLK